MSATILCVQEDREIYDLYAESLEAEGYRTLPAHDGGQALEILRRESPDFVVLDVYLPRQDGFEILAELRSMPGRDSLPVLLLSAGDLSPEIERRAKGLGAIGIAPSPISPDQLIARIAKFVKASHASRDGDAARAPREGDLREIPFPELLHGLHRERLDGVALLEHGKKRKAVELRDGWPVAIKSNLVSECLGPYLVKMGRCTKEELDQSIARMKAGEGLQGEILVAMDVLDEEGVVAALRDHALAKLYEIFSWQTGRFVIRSGARLQRGSSTGLDAHPNQVVVEGARRGTPLKLIDRSIERHADSFIHVSSDALSGAFHDVSLDESELDWIHSLDGSRKVGSLAGEPESIRRLVYGLVSIELLTIDARSVDRDREHAAAAEVQIELDTPVGSDEEERIRSDLAELANRMQDQDHYGVLGVASTAGDDEIRAAYTALAKRAHPDRFHAASGSVRQLASRVFERINEANQAIATAEDRAAFARERSLGKKAAEVQDEGRQALKAETEFQRGEARLAERDYESALLCYGRAIESFPSEGEYRSAYGWCLYLCHPDNEVMLGEALEHCREGVRLAKDREKPYLLLGRLYKAMGKPGAARKMFTRAVQIKPQCVEAMRELRIMNMRRDRDKGVLKRLFKR
jgi:CheY-like chemotaxis protein/tetratricopeptide (TPR) repeat protein